MGRGGTCVDVSFIQLLELDRARARLAIDTLRINQCHGLGSLRSPAGSPSA